MDPTDELQQLIALGENDSVDFKQRVSQPDKIARTLVSFANTRGGVILVGVQDDGTVSGVDPEEEKYSLQLAADFYCDPPVEVRYEELEEEAYTVLKVIIPESRQKPHYAKVKQNDWRAYVRVRDTSVQTSKLVDKALATEDPNFEPIPLSRHELAVLDYLQSKPRITLKQYMQLSNLSERRAYRTLVKLVIHGYLRLHDKEKEAYYTLS